MSVSGLGEVKCFEKVIRQQAQRGADVTVPSARGKAQIERWVLRQYDLKTGFRE